MTDFQVGDRVSVEGVVTDLWPDSKHGPMSMVQITGEETPNEVWVEDRAITLVDRPRRKLRVGSVWERRLTPNSEMFDRYVWTGAKFVSPNGDNYSREGRDLDTHPHHWREVPVEELEREVEP